VQNSSKVPISDFSQNNSGGKSYWLYQWLLEAAAGFKIEAATLSQRWCLTYSF